MNQADVEKALDYINRRLTECITLEEIAKYCGYSAFHFSREFTKQTGMGVFDTMIKMRMNRAKSMLTSSSKSVLEIALESGYETHNGFTTAFIKWIGCNPTVYRVHENKSKQYERQEPNLKAKNLSNSLMSTQRLTREGHTRGVQMGASMENTVIRFWRMEDVNDIWENVFSRNTPEEIKARIREDLKKLEEKTGFHVVAQVNGVVVGTLGCLRVNAWARNAQLCDFVIHPNYQGKGLARLLLNGLIEEMKTHLSENNPVSMLMTCTGAEPENQIVVQKYKTLGFREAITAGGLIYLVMAV